MNVFKVKTQSIKDPYIPGIKIFYKNVDLFIVIITDQKWLLLNILDSHKLLVLSEFLSSFMRISQLLEDSKCKLNGARVSSMGVFVMDRRIILSGMRVVIENIEGQNFKAHSQVLQFNTYFQPVTDYSHGHITHCRSKHESKQPCL